MENGNRWALCALTTLNRELNDSSVFAKRVDGVAREEARVLPHGWHDLMDEPEKQEETVKPSCGGSTSDSSVPNKANGGTTSG